MGHRTLTNSCIMYIIQILNNSSVPAANILQVYVIDASLFKIVFTLVNTITQLFEKVKSVAMSLLNQVIVVV